MRSRTIALTAARPPKKVAAAVTFHAGVSDLREVMATLISAMSTLLAFSHKHMARVLRLLAPSRLGQPISGRTAGLSRAVKAAIGVSTAAYLALFCGCHAAKVLRPSRVSGYQTWSQDGREGRGHCQHIAPIAGRSGVLFPAEDGRTATFTPRTV